MEYRTLHSAGRGALTVSAIGLGCNNFGRRCDAEETRAVIDAALDAGVTLLDTADSYGIEAGSSERYIGQTLGPRRKDVVIASKFGLSGGAAPAYARACAEASLARLGTDYIDLYQIHKPDPATPIVETLGALNDLVTEGKVRFIGCSNFSGAQLTEAIAIARREGYPSFVTAQNQYSLIHRDIEPDLMPVCEAHGVGILPFYPLASGLLTGKYKRGQVPAADMRLAEDTPRAKRARAAADFDLLEALEAFARERGRSLLELAMSWTVARPAIVSVISGARTPDQVRQNVAAAGWALTDAEIEQVDRLSSR